MAEKLKALNAQLNARAAASAIASGVADAVKNYRSSKLPWPMKIAMPATLAAIPLVGLHGAGIAAFGSAIGLPVLLMVFLGTAGITSILEAVVTNPHLAPGVAIIAAHIIAAEVSRRGKNQFQDRLADEPISSRATPMPCDKAELRAALYAINPYAFEQHVMSFFEKTGLLTVVTPKSRDYGMDGSALHPEGLIVVQCKRNAPDNKVGRPTLQQFKAVMSDADAYRGFMVTTSSFTSDAKTYAFNAPKMILVDMEALVEWHESGLRL